MSTPSDNTNAPAQALFAEAVADHRRITIFPMVASWKPRQKEVRWLGSTQIRPTYAQRLVRCWRRWTPDKGADTPSILWHPVDGDGHCLVRLGWMDGAWRAAAGLISRRDFLALSANPFLMMYGHDMPLAEDGRLEGRPVEAGRLLEVARERVGRASQFQALEDGQELARLWWMRASKSAAPPRLVAPDNPTLMLAAWNAWLKVPPLKRPGLSLALSPHVPTPAHNFGPLLVCLRQDSPLLEVNRPVEAPAAPAQEPVAPVLAPSASQAVAAPSSVEPPAPVSQDASPQAAPILAQAPQTEPPETSAEQAETSVQVPRASEAADVEGFVGGAAVEVKPSTASLGSVSGGLMASTAELDARVSIAQALPDDASQAGRPETFEGPVPSESRDFTDQLLFMLRADIERVRVDRLEAQVRARVKVRDAEDYAFALDRLVCGLAPCATVVPVEVVVNVVVAYCPENCAVGHQEACWEAFADAVVDVARMMRVGHLPEATLGWVDTMCVHERSALLLERGLASRLSRRVVRLYGEMAQVALSKGLELRQQARQQTLTEQHRAWVSALTAHVDMEPKPASASQEVGAVAEVARQIGEIANPAPETDESPMPMAPITPPRPMVALQAQPQMDVEGRLLQAWGVAQHKRPCLVWHDLTRGAQGWDRLVELVQEHPREAEREPDLYPVSVSVAGPGLSQRLFEESVLFRTQVGGPVPRPVVPMSDDDDVVFDMAGPSFDCLPMRNLWARVGGQQHRGVGSGAGAVLVAPIEGALRWPRLVGRADGLVVTLDLMELVGEPERVRERLEAFAKAVAVERQGSFRTLPCAVVFDGAERLTHHTHGAVIDAITQAQTRLGERRRGGFDFSLLEEAGRLGHLVLQSVDGAWVESFLMNQGFFAAFFVGGGAKSRVDLADVPLVWLMNSCRVQLNLMHGHSAPLAEPVGA